MRLIEVTLGAILESDHQKEHYIRVILDMENDDQQEMISVVQRVIGDPTQPKLSKSISERYFDLSKFNELLPKLDELERDNQHLSQMVEQLKLERTESVKQNRNLMEVLEQKDE